MRVGLVVPHIFMHRDILPHVIFSPGTLALDLAKQLPLTDSETEVTLFTPGPVDTPATNITADMSYFDHELAGRDDTYLELLKKHPFTFVTLARQVQSELIAKAYTMANHDQLDLVHIYTNEEDIALPFASFCHKPVVFTHHDPFNFLVKYKNIFPKYKHLPWLSISMNQRQGMPSDTNWLANIYHGIDETVFFPDQTKQTTKLPYVAYFGRIIEAKGVHLAIEAIKKYNQAHPHQPLQLRIAGKHYAGQKDTYWQTRVVPEIDGKNIIYRGFIKDDSAKREFLANATALLTPSTFQEPFGMVMIEALACGTPIIGLRSGAIPEIIQDGQTGFIINQHTSETKTVEAMAEAIHRLPTIARQACRTDFEHRFTLNIMAQGHIAAYQKAIETSK